MLVVTAVDRAFLELAAVMLASLAHNGGPAVRDVVVFTSAAGDKHHRALARSYGRENIRFVPVDGQIGATLRGLYTRRQVSPISYLRLFIPDILKDEHGLMLYLDPDIVVNGDLSALADVSLQPFVAAGVENLGQGGHAARLGLPAGAAYMNAGVVLTDLDRWRAEGITARALAALRANPAGFRYMDQDALNLALRGRWLKLERTWNFYAAPGDPEYDSAQFAAAHVIHFVGRVKPNSSDSGHPAQAIFLQHRLRTPWAGKQLLGPRRRKLQHAWRSLSRRLQRLTIRERP